MTPFGDDPDADWTDEYAWTRYRGPQPYPVPGDWTLNLVEGDGVMWNRYPAHGEGREMDDHVLESFKEATDTYDDPYEAYNDAREEWAGLGHEVLEWNAAERTETLKQVLKIEGNTVFERVEPDGEDLWKVTANALAQYDDGTPVEEIEVSFSTGSKPPDQLREEMIEQRQAENEYITNFGGDSDGE